MKREPPEVSEAQFNTPYVCCKCFLPERKCKVNGGIHCEVIGWWFRVAGRMGQLLDRSSSFSLRQDPGFYRAGSRPQRGAAWESGPVPLLPRCPAGAKALGLLPLWSGLGLLSRAWWGRAGRANK